MTCHFVHHPASASILCPEDRNSDIWINLSPSKLKYFIIIIFYILHIHISKFASPKPRTEVVCRVPGASM